MKILSLSLFLRGCNLSLSIQCFLLRRDEKTQAITVAAKTSSSDLETAFLDLFVSQR